MGAGRGETKRTRFHVPLLGRLRAPEPLAFDGVTCPVREHTADGYPVGRCDFPVYGGYCRRHGYLADHLNKDGTGDDRDFPSYGLRTWPVHPAHREQLGVNESIVEFDRARGKA